MTTTIYLLRHGEVHNPEGIIYGRLPGYRLNEVGRGQVRTAGEFLAERGPFDALITSPLERARESAGIIAERLGLAEKSGKKFDFSRFLIHVGNSPLKDPRPAVTRILHASAKSSQFWIH